MKTKEFIIGIIFILTSLIVYSLFFVDGKFQQIFATLTFFVFLPILFNKFILKYKFIKKDLNVFGDYKQNLLLSAAALFLLALIFILISYYFDFIGNYAIPVFITKNFINFLFYEFIVVLPIIAIYEFYFRGFVMSLLKVKLGLWSVLLQAFIFFILVFLNNKDQLIQYLPYLITAPFAGFVAYKSKSIFYSGVIQFIVVFVLNLIVIKSIG